MNVNWKEAILQAQKKIDQVLDIRPETLEDDKLETEKPEELSNEDCSSPSQSSDQLVDDIVMLEPVLPPFLNNRYIGDDIQTIISSDIEHLTRASSRTVSPERLKLPSELERDISSHPASPVHTSAANLEVTLPNPEDILNQAIYGLRRELTEYKKANQILQVSHANLERELEENRFTMNEKLVNMLNEERENSNQEISQLKLTCSQAIAEKLEMEEKYRIVETQVAATKKSLNYLKNQMSHIKRNVTESGNSFASDFESFGAEIRRTLNNQVKRKKSEYLMNQVAKHSCNCAKVNQEDSNTHIKQDGSSQTDWEYHGNQDTHELKEKSKQTENRNSGNVTDLLQIIEQLEVEKRQLLAQKRSDKYAIEKLNEQLNETLIMHGEKIEQLDEVIVDNEELKSILKQQALALTM
ncbi:hypothetical protein L3Y34_010231 [Caenorhabditis briggsae]|uniref:Uncharacterized protein n=1 Tax=Caenorhabditis briggsae TaxID=6238 RepID=A0AAE9CSF0_CAEBR|nr:hypothetical protein L3Y34_010231 [Caenorhabditis briggsae]